MAMVSVQVRPAGEPVDGVGPAILLCARDPLSDDWHRTFLWSPEVRRYVAARSEDALVMAVAARPELVVVDRDLPGAEGLIRSLRADATRLRPPSIVVTARGDFEPSEACLIDAGADAVVRAPVDSEGDARLRELLGTVRHRAVRFRVLLQFESLTGTAPVESAWGHALDLSAVGMRVAVNRRCQVGMDVDFLLFVDGGRPVAGCGEVVRVPRDGSWEIRFYGTEADGPERIRQLVHGAGAGVDRH